MPWPGQTARSLDRRVGPSASSPSKCALISQHARRVRPHQEAPASNQRLSPPPVPRHNPPHPHLESETTARGPIRPFPVSSLVLTSELAGKGRTHPAFVRRDSGFSPGTRTGSGGVRRPGRYRATAADLKRPATLAISISQAFSLVRTRFGVRPHGPSKQQCGRVRETGARGESVERNAVTWADARRLDGRARSYAPGPAKHRLIGQDTNVADPV